MLKYNQQKEKGFTLLYAVLVSSIILAASLSIINIALKQHKLAALSRESKIAFYAANTGIDCALYWDTHGRDVIDSTGPIKIPIFPAVIDTLEGIGYDDPTKINDDQRQAARTDNDGTNPVIYCLGSDIIQSQNFYGAQESPIKMTYKFDTDDEGPLNGKWLSHFQFTHEETDNANEIASQGEFCLDKDLEDAENYRTWIFQIIMPDSDGTVASTKDNACAIVSVCKHVSTPDPGEYSTIYTAKGYNTCDITKENVVERGIRLMSD